MKIPKPSPIPGHAWPVGSRLRFRLDADLQPKYQFLRGTPVIVLTPLTWSSPTDGFPYWAWRQQVLSLAFGRPGGAQPGHLEPLPDDPLVHDLRQAERGKPSPVEVE